MVITQRQKTFQKISNVKILFITLSDRWKKEFIESLNKNPLRIVIESKEFELENITNYYQYKDYFIYQENKQSHQLHFIGKNQVDKFTNNMKKTIINDMKSTNKNKQN